MKAPENHARARHVADGEVAVAWAQGTAAGADVARQIRSRVRRNRQRQFVTGAMALALIVTLGTIFRSSPSENLAPAAAATATVSLPQRQVLPDGTLVELKDGAKIEVRFGAEDRVRRVILSEGEAHFAVAKNPDRPFVVAAAGVDVRAVGTAFSVALDHERVAVVVTEGRVQVGRDPTRQPEAGPAAATLLEAGHSVVVDLAAAPADLQPVQLPANEMAQAMAWRAPRIRFANTPLREAIAVFNEHSATQLELQPGLEELRVGGIIRADNTDSFLLLLKGEFGIEAKPTDRGKLELTRP